MAAISYILICSYNIPFVIYSVAPIFDLFSEFAWQKTTLIFMVELMKPYFEIFFHDKTDIVPDYIFYYDKSIFHQYFDNFIGRHPGKIIVFQFPSGILTGN